MYYVFFDLEWNQSFANDISFMKRCGMPVTGEIIEIGAVKVNEAFEQVDSFKVFVKPKYLRTMHKHVEKLTGITNEMIAAGIPFTKAADIFSAWCGGDSIILSWGNDDIVMWRENLTLHRMDNNLTIPWYDAQLIYAYDTFGNTSQHSLQSAMEEKNIDTKGLDAHDALHDAYFTSRVCSSINMDKAILYFDEQLRTKHSPIVFPKIENFFIYEGYTDKRTVLRDSKVKKVFCPYCLKQLATNRIERLHGDKFLQLGNCESHGEFAIQYRIGRYQRAKQGIKHYVTKTITRNAPHILGLYEKTSIINRKKEEAYKARLKERHKI